MAVDFSIRFIVDRKTPVTVIRVTDESTGLSSQAGILKVTYPNGFVYENTDFSSPDISAQGGTKDIPLQVDSKNRPIIGSYTFTYQVLDGVTVDTASKTFTFQWVEPTVVIENTSDVVLPEVKFKDSSDYDVGGFSESYTTWLIIANTPSTSEIGVVQKLLNADLSTRELDLVNDGNYYEGVYTPTVDVDILYTSDSLAFLSVQFVSLTSKEFVINRVPTQKEIIEYIETYKSQISEGEKETYDYIIALYNDIIERIQADSFDGTEPVLRELLNLLNITYDNSFQPNPLTPFQVQTRGFDAFLIFDGDGTKFLSDDGSYKEISLDAIIEEDITAAGLDNDQGSIGNGDTVLQGTTLTEFAKALLIKFNYLSPILSLTSSTPLNVEAGTTISPLLTPTFTQRDAGALSQLRFKDGSTTIQTQPDASAYTVTSFVIGDENKSYTAEVDYLQGSLKPGDTVGDGRIAAGTITSNPRVYRGQRKAFYGTDTSQTTINSAYIRGLSGSLLGAANGSSFTITIPSGTGRVVFAYPATLRNVTEVKSLETNFDVKDVFTLTTVSVAGASGFTSVNYKVYEFVPAVPFGAAANYEVTI